LRFVFSVFRLVSRRCHHISTIHQLAPAPHRSVRAVFPHPALQTGSHRSRVDPTVNLTFGSCLAISDSRFSFVDNSLLALCPLIVSPPRYTCLSTPSLRWHYPASQVQWVDPTTYAPSPGLVSSASGTPPLFFKEEGIGPPRFLTRSFGQHAMDYDPGGVSAISPITMTSLLPSMFLITWTCSTT